MRHNTRLTTLLDGSAPDRVAKRWVDEEAARQQVRDDLEKTPLQHAAEAPVAEASQ